jgi:hypothetical protein
MDDGDGRRHHAPDSHRRADASQGKRTIASEINEADTVDLGRWLSARTGFPLTVPRQLQ